MSYLWSFYNNDEEKKTTTPNYKIIHEDAKLKHRPLPIVAFTCMVKNEKDNILRSLNTCLEIADLVILLDTGSTDETIEITRKFCKDNKLPFFCIQSNWIDDFSYSRNILLSYADDKADVLLLYDANDELKEPFKLKVIINSTFTNKEIKGYYVEQEWREGENLDTYRNIKLIKTKQGWKYSFPIHEYIFIPDLKAENVPTIDANTKIKYYQDRKEDNKRTSKRQTKDKEVLFKAHMKNPLEPRTIFYLAQTLSACGEYKAAYIYYQKRLKFTGHMEEIFLSYVKCGELALLLNHGWEECMIWFLKAFEFMPRVEPLIRIVMYYYTTKNIHMAFTFIRAAVILSYPVQATLFISKHFYDYLRWHLYAKIAYDIGLKEEAKRALENILQFQKPCDLSLYEAIVKNKIDFKNESVYKFENTKVFTF